MIHECLSIRRNLSLCHLFVTSSETSFRHLPVQRGSCQFLSLKPVLLGGHHNLSGKMDCLLSLPTRVSIKSVGMDLSVHRMTQQRRAENERRHERVCSRAHHEDCPPASKGGSSLLEEDQPLPGPP